MGVPWPQGFWLACVAACCFRHAGSMLSVPIQWRCIRSGARAEVMTQFGRGQLCIRILGKALLRWWRTTTCVHTGQWIGGCLGDCLNLESCEREFVDLCSHEEACAMRLPQIVQHPCWVMACHCLLCCQCLLAWDWEACAV
jgi:hypothetical protein